MKMKSNSSMRLLSLLSLIVFVIQEAPFSRASDILVSDGFTSPTQDSTNKAIHSANTWYAFASSGGTLPTAATPTSGGFNGDGVLQFSSQNQQTSLISSFTPTTLQTGQTLTLSVKYGYSFPPSSNSYISGFQIGLYNSNGTSVSAGNLSGGTGGTSDDLGYSLSKLPNSTTNDLQLGNQTGALSSFTSFTQTSNSVLLNDTNAYTLSLGITLQNDGSLLFTYGINSSFYTYTLDSSLVSTTTFDEILIAPVTKGSSSVLSKTIYVGDVELVSTIPEPSTAMALLFGLIGLSIQARFRRRG